MSSALKRQQHCFRRMIVPAGGTASKICPNSPSKARLESCSRASSVSRIHRLEDGDARPALAEQNRFWNNRSWSSDIDRISRDDSGSSGHGQKKFLRRGSLSLLLGAGLVSAVSGKADDESSPKRGSTNNASSNCGDKSDMQGAALFNCRGIRIEVEEKEKTSNKQEYEQEQDNRIDGVVEGLLNDQGQEPRPAAEEKKEKPKSPLRRPHSLKAEQPELEDKSNNKSGLPPTFPISKDLESDSDSEQSGSEDDAKSSSKAKKSSKEQKPGFRDRKIIDYENRIRTYSAPDKIFRYFATYKSVQADGEVFMTPSDFLRSLTPGIKQPDGLGLDQFRKFDPQVGLPKGAEEDLSEDSIFYHLGRSGLISFSDYIFLLTILSTSRRQFEIAFRMFDLNGDGDVDAEEFAKVQEIIQQTTANGKKHREMSHHNQKFNSALAVYFFGEAMDGKLTIERFLHFQTQLQSEILALEFQRKSPNDEGLITEKQFAELLLTYADYSSKKRSNVLKRVKKAYKAEEKSMGVSLKDYEGIFILLMHIEDVDKALYFYRLAGASIDPHTLRHVAKVCAGVELSDHVIDVIFTIFDDDGNGGLSNKEFVAVMKNKLKRGLEKPKDTGLFNFFAAVTKCAVTTPIS